MTSWSSCSFDQLTNVSTPCKVRCSMGTGSLLHKVNIMMLLSANALIAGLISFAPVLNSALVGQRRYCTFPLLAFVSPITTRVNQREMIVSPNPLRNERCECIWNRQVRHVLGFKGRSCNWSGTWTSRTSRPVNRHLIHGPNCQHVFDDSHYASASVLWLIQLFAWAWRPWHFMIFTIHEIFRSKLPKHAGHLPWSSALQHCVSCPSRHKRSLSKRESTCFATKQCVIYLEIVREFEKWRSVQLDTWAVSIFSMNAMMRTST